MSAAWWYRLLLRAYPRTFRVRFGIDLEELFLDLYRSRAAAMPLPKRARFWGQIVADTLRQGLAERLGHRQRRLPLHAHHGQGQSFMRHMVEDAAHAIRALRHQPGLATGILVTLALAIGANTAIFTVVNAVLLRPLPYGDPDRVVILYMVDRAGRDQLMSHPDVEDLQRSLTTITGLSPAGTQTANLTGNGEPDRLRAGFVAADFFTTLRVRAAIGRTFAPGDDARGARKTAILEHDVWQTRFGGDPNILGRSLVLNNEPHDVIGVLPRTFEFPIAEADIWLPASSSPLQDRRRESRYLMVFGRIADHVSFEQADAELKQAAQALAQTNPDTNSNWSMRLEDVHSLSVMFVQRNLWMLMGAVGFVLLIACANIANLLLARASARQREIAVRTALGAPRTRIVSQLLLESILLAVVGGALGLILSAALTDGMLALLPTLPRGQSVAPNLTVVLFTAGVSIATGIVFGLAPALRLSQPNLRLALNEGTRAGEGRTAGRFRAALIVTELTLSMMLLAGAGLFIQSLVRLTRVDLGYDPANVLTLEYRLPRNKYSTPEQQVEFHQRVIDRIAELRDVRAVAFAGAAPQSGNGSYIGYWKAEDPQPTRDVMARAQANVVSDRYFAALGVPLVDGRTCGPQDQPRGTRSIIVNRLLADRVWPGERAVGKQLRSLESADAAVVIGVVGDTKPNLLSQPTAPQIYACLSQSAGIFATLVIKTAGDPLAPARSVQQAIWSVDPDQPMWKIRSAESMVHTSVQRERFVMWLMAIAAGLALVLAGVGTYGVLSYTVQRRAREVGVRMALGATRGSIVRLVLRQTAVLTLLGVAGGILGALGLGSIVATQLYQVSPHDPYTLAMTAFVLTTVALVAAVLPTRRAASVDPILTLRAE